MTARIGPVDSRDKLRAFLRRHTLNVLWLIRQGNSTQRGIDRSIDLCFTGCEQKEWPLCSF